MDINAVVQEVEKKLTAAIEKYDGQVKDAGSAAVELRAEVKKLAEEHKSEVEKSAALQARLREVEQKAADGYKGTETKAKTWGESLVDSESFASFKAGGTTKAKIEVKNTILGEVGGNPSNILVPQDRLPGIVPGAFRQLTLLDFMPTGATGSNQVEYTRELLWNNQAAETAEGAPKLETDNTFQLVQEPVRTIAHWLRLSKQVLDDAPALSSYVDRRLRHGILQRLESQLIVGTGLGSNLSGIVNAPLRSTLFVPFAGPPPDTQVDSINRAKYLVAGAEYQANFVLLNPADWGVIERMKRTDNGYVAGDGAGITYINNGLTPVIWGLPVVLSNAVPAGFFAVGDSNAMQLFMRQQATVEMFEQDGTNVTANLVTVRAEMRAAFAVFVPAAIQYGALV